MSVVDTVLEVTDVLHRAQLPHAFGGALALAYVIEPRGTVDVDVNVFVTPEDIELAVTPLAGVGYGPERDDWAPISGMRLRRADDVVPVDLFPSVDPRYDEILARVERRPFGAMATEIPVLAAEDLAVFKLSFGRDKDWVDLARMAEARQDLDIDQIEDLVVGLRGPTIYPRVARLRSMLDRA